MKDLIKPLDYSPLVMDDLDESELKAGNWVYTRVGTNGPNGERLFKYEPIQLTGDEGHPKQFYYPIAISKDLIRAVADGPEVHPNAFNEHVEVFPFFCPPYNKIAYRLTNSVRLYADPETFLDIPNLHTLQNVYFEATGRELSRKSK